MNSPKKSSKEDLFLRFHRRHVHVRRICGSREQLNPGVHRRVQLRDLLTSFASMSSPGTYSGTTWQSSSKKYCSSSEDAILLFLLLLFSVLLFCAVFLRCGCVQKEKEEASSVSQRSRREREREESRETERKKNFQKKRTKSFWLLDRFFSGCFFWSKIISSEVGISSHENKKHCV